MEIPIKYQDFTSWQLGAGLFLPPFFEFMLRGLAGLEELSGITDTPLRKLTIGTSNFQQRTYAPDVSFSIPHGFHIVVLRIHHERTIFSITQSTVGKL